MRKIIIAILFLVALTTIVQHAKAATPVTLTADESQMLALVNQERAKAGVSPLTADATLTKLARLKSQDMITKNYFSHTSPTYGDPFQMMKTYGVTYRTAGENIAGNQTVDRAHTALMNSAGHRANILNKDFTRIGIGIIDGGTYGKMFTQEFTGGQNASAPVQSAPVQPKVTPAPKPAPTPKAPTHKVDRALTALRVRMGPGSQYRQFATLYPWYTAEQVARWGAWDLVRLDDGRLGLILNKYVEVI